MPYSKFDKELEFNENEFVVSLINTKTGLSSIFGGHAKIVVEGVKVDKNRSLGGSKLFIAEYHIMEANRIPEHSWIPQALRNTKCNYLVLFTERDNYNARQEQQYQKVQARSVGGLEPSEVQKMIDNIKHEQNQIQNNQKVPKFQYAGKWCAYGVEDAHNCTTWAEEKLNIIGIGKQLVSDSSKASPFLHVNSGYCNLL